MSDARNTKVWKSTQSAPFSSGFLRFTLTQYFCLSIRSHLISTAIKHHTEAFTDLATPPAVYLLLNAVEWKALGENKPPPWE